MNGTYLQNGTVPICREALLAVIGSSELTNFGGICQWLIKGVFVMLVGCAGAAGNAYGVVMLAGCTVRRSVAILLGSLALWDMAVCVSVQAFYALSDTLMPLFAQQIVFFEYFTVWVHPISNLSMVASFWTLVVITVERFFAISQPLKHRAVDTAARARVLCACAAVGAVIYCIPQYFELTVAKCMHPEGYPKYYVWATELRQQTLYITIYKTYAQWIFVSFGPFAIILVVTIRTIMLVRTARMHRQRMLGSTNSAMPTPVNKSHTRLNGDAAESRRNSACVQLQPPVIANAGAKIRQISTPIGTPLATPLATPMKKQVQVRQRDTTTPMLLAIAIKFILFNTMTTALCVAEYVQPDLPKISHAYLVLSQISNLLVVANSASNCLVYIRWKATLTASSNRTRCTTTGANQNAMVELSSANHSAKFAALAHRQINSRISKTLPRNRSTGTLFALAELGHAGGGREKGRAVCGGGGQVKRK